MVQWSVLFQKKKDVLVVFCRYTLVLSRSVLERLLSSDLGHWRNGRWEEGELILVIEKTGLLSLSFFDDYKDADDKRKERGSETKIGSCGPLPRNDMHSPVLSFYWFWFITRSSTTETISHRIRMNGHFQRMETGRNNYLIIKLRRSFLFIFYFVF